MIVESDNKQNVLDVHDLLHLNLVKADPILRLLCALKGFEDGLVPFPEAWSVFKLFIQLPTRVKDGGATFQASSGDPDPGVLDVFIGRQLSEDSGRGWIETRVVGFAFVFHPSESESEDGDDLVSGEEFWSANFATEDEFFAAVEGSAGFRAASSREVMAVTFYSQEDAADAEPGDS